MIMVNGYSCTLRRWSVKAVIVDWARSAFHRAHRGDLAGVRPDDLAGQVAKALIDRNGIDPAEFDDLLLGMPIRKVISLPILYPCSASG